MTYQKKLKAYIKRKHLKQVELSKILGVDPVVLNRWINGRAVPRPVWQKIIDSKIKLDFS